MTQVIGGIKAIKFSAWEDKFLSRLTGQRAVECKALGRYRFWAQTGVQLGRATPVLAACGSFTYLALRDAGAEGGAGAGQSAFLGSDVFAALGWDRAVVLR